MICQPRVMSTNVFLTTQGKNVNPTHRHPAAAISHACDPSNYVRGRSVGNCIVIERFHLNFRKYILSLNKCTYTNMLYGETGEIPLSLRVKWCRIIKYWSRLITCQARKLSSFIYRFIFSIHTNNVYHSPWILFVKKILCDCGFWGSGKAKLFPLE